MRLLVVIHSMDAGGTQRFLANLADGLVQRRVDLTVATLSLASQPDFFALPPDVVRHKLSFDEPPVRSRLSKLRRDVSSLRRLRRLVRSVDPDVVLSLGWSTNVITLSSTRFLGVPVVISERVDPRDSADRRRGWALAQRLLYPFADHLVTQTAGVETFMRRWVRRGRISTIANPVPGWLFDVDREPSPSPHIVAVCRLSVQKGVDELVRAFALLCDEYPKAQLSLVGDGPERDALVALADDLGVRESITFHGMLDDPTQVSRTAWIGCLASRNEGFPNALAEMMAMALPCISTDCRSGPADLLGDGAGLLVPVDDPTALAHGLGRLVQDDVLRARMGDAGRRRALTFRDNVVLDEWYRLLQSLSSEPERRH